MTQKIIKKGNLEYRERKKTTGTYFAPVLVNCPVCGFKFTENCDRPHHIATHTPEEFGL